MEHPPGKARTSTQTGVGVLDRSVAVLDAIEDGARTLTRITETTGLTRTTAHRLVKALEAHGFIQLHGGFGYRLGPRLLTLARLALEELPLRDLAHPALTRLAESTGESVQLFVRSGDERVCVDAVESHRELRTLVHLGAALPITAGSAGKVFMAWTGDADQDRLVRMARKLTPETPTGNRLREELREIRNRGWAESSGEREPGVASVSAPVLGRLGRLEAVVSVSGPAIRIGRFRARRYAPAVLHVATEIRRTLGAG
jgi:DNA-binding IclR family transcriptional regulator